MDNKDYPKTELIEKADVTELFDPSDIENNKFLALLSYVSFLVLIPVLGLSILGILNVVNGRARRLPFIGHIKLLK